VKIFPVLSQPDDGWTGESGYVQVKCLSSGFKFHIISFTGNDCLHTWLYSQAAFSKAKQISNPLATGAVLCGQKQMTEVCY